MPSCLLLTTLGRCAVPNSCKDHSHENRDNKGLSFCENQTRQTRQTRQIGTERSDQIGTDISDQIGTDRSDKIGTDRSDRNR